MAQAHPQTMSSQKPSPQMPNLSNEADDGISKVRDILFGAKVKEQNEKFELLQQKVDSKFSMLREEQLERFNVLEKYTKEEVRALTDRLGNEKNERDKAFAKLTKTIDDLRHDAEEKLARLATDNSKATSDVRSFVLSCTKDLSEKVHSAQKKFSDDFNKELKLLNDRKVNRLHMVELLHDWSARLSEQPPQNQ